MSSISFPH